MRIRKPEGSISRLTGDRRGVLLFGIIVIVAVLGIMYFKGYILQSTETRRIREVELDAKLSQIRKAFDDAKNDKNFKDQVSYDSLDETTKSETVRDTVIGSLRNSSKYQAKLTTAQRKMDTNAVYLRQEFDAPMLDVDDVLVDDKFSKNVGWRIAYNRVNSSSFEGDNFMTVHRIKEMSDVAKVDQWWFATTTPVTLIDEETGQPAYYEVLIAVTSTFDPPPEIDYSGQKDSYGNRGKYGKNVLYMKVK